MEINYDKHYELRNACIRNDVDICMNLLQSSTDDFRLSAYDEITNETILMCACKMTRETIALKILELPHECNLNHTNNEFTALTIALDNNMPNVCDRIKEIHDDVSYIFFERNWFYLYSHEAELLEKIKLMDIKKLSKVQDNNTILLLSLENELYTICNEILKYPTHCKLDYADIDENTPLMLACKSGAIDIVLKMLETPELVDPYAKNNENCTVLDCINNTRYGDDIDISKVKDKVLDLIYGEKQDDICVHI